MTEIRIQRPSAGASNTSWSPPVEPSFEEWRDAGRRFAAIGRAIPWLLGDWLRLGEMAYGERSEAEILDLGYEVGELMDLARVAARFPARRRRANLSWEHHRVAAELDAEVADRLLERAEAFGWTVRQLRSEVRRASA